MHTTIKTNHHTRPIFSFHETPESTQEDFDYIEGEDRHVRRLFEYRGEWYDYYEFAVAPDEFKALGWDGCQTESAFSAVVVTYFDRDGYELDDEIIVGYAHW